MILQPFMFFKINIFPLSCAASKPRQWLPVKTNVAPGWQTPASGKAESKKAVCFPRSLHSGVAHTHRPLQLQSFDFIFLSWSQITNSINMFLQPRLHVKPGLHRWCKIHTHNLQFIKKLKQIKTTIELSLNSSKNLWLIYYTESVGDLSLATAASQHQRVFTCVAFGKVLFVIWNSNDIW